MKNRYDRLPEIRYGFSLYIRIMIKVFDAPDNF